MLATPHLDDLSIYPSLLTCMSDKLSAMDLNADMPQSYLGPTGPNEEFPVTEIKVRLMPLVRGTLERKFSFAFHLRSTFIFYIPSVVLHSRNAV